MCKENLRLLSEANKEPRRGRRCGPVKRDPRYQLVGEADFDAALEVAAQGIGE